MILDARDVAGIKDGALVLLASIMDYDIWIILLSGVCHVMAKQGVPEGSKYGSDRRLSNYYRPGL